MVVYPNAALRVIYTIFGSPRSYIHILKVHKEKLNDIKAKAVGEKSLAPCGYDVVVRPFISFLPSSSRVTTHCPYHCMFVENLIKYVVAVHTKQLEACRG